jgi:FkbM family methyltransferase
MWRERTTSLKRPWRLSLGRTIRRVLERPAVFSSLSWLARNAVGRRVVAALETSALARMLKQTTQPGPDGRALGFLFGRYEPGRTPRQIYDDVFSQGRFESGYQSQMAQDLLLNRWLFKNRGPGFFVDVGAFDGQLGSNTFFFEKRLGWSGVAFEPNPPAFETLQRTRLCQAIQGCAYNRDGDVSFLALSENGQRRRTKEMLRPANFSSLALDRDHGAVMLSGIHEHIDNMPRVDQARELWSLDQSVVTVPCYRIDSVLADRGVSTVDYLSIDVEGAELQVLQGIDFTKVRVNVIGVERSRCFGDVYRLLTDAGFDYHGLLFFDEIFVHREPRFTWEQ